MSTNPIVVNHDEIDAVTSRLRDIIADSATIKSTLQQTLENAQAEASINTGTPAPVFHPVLTAMADAVERLNSALDIIADRLSNGVAAMEKASATAKQTAEESAAAVDGTASESISSK